MSAHGELAVQSLSAHGSQLRAKKYNYHNWVSLAN